MTKAVELSVADLNRINYLREQIACWKDLQRLARPGSKAVGMLGAVYSTPLAGGGKQMGALTCKGSLDPEVRAEEASIDREHGDILNIVGTIFGNHVEAMAGEVVAYLESQLPVRIVDGYTGNVEVPASSNASSPPPAPAKTVMKELGVSELVAMFRKLKLAGVVGVVVSDELANRLYSKFQSQHELFSDSDDGAPVVFPGPAWQDCGQIQVDAATVFRGDSFFYRRKVASDIGNQEPSPVNESTGPAPVNMTEEAVAAAI